MGGFAFGQLSLGAVLIGSFIACSVEVTEMVIIVVGVGSTREWKSTIFGAASGLLVLVVLIAGLGEALSLVPINPLRVAIGALLLTFGLQWLRQGVIGVAADGFSGGEDEEEATAAGGDRKGVLDWTAWLLAFKGVTLEGLEVAFIVIAFGAGSRGGGGGYLDALVGAAAAFVVVGTAGLLALKWVKKVPGRSLKFGVGGLISTFGTYWAMEGLGVHWPGGRLSLAWMYALFLGLSLVLAALARRGVLGPAPAPTVLSDTGPALLGVAPASAASVQRYQRLRGLAPTGNVDASTQAAMRAERAERAGDGVNPGVVGVDAADPEQVQQVQRRFGLAVTGTVDAATRGALRVMQHPAVLDPLDESAVRRFQQDHDVTVTGRVDDETRAAARAVSAELSRSGSDDDEGRPDPLQAYEGLDAADAGSVRRFQAAFHLEPDGVIGQETRGALRAARALLGPAAGASPRSGGVARADAVPGPGGAGDAGPDPADTAAVRAFQRGYHIEPTGDVDTQTRRALRWEREHLLGVDVSSPGSVREFQRRHGLNPDGVVGPRTQAAMRAARLARQPDDSEPGERYGRARRHAAGFGVGLDPADPESVRGFQRNHHLRDDGIVGPQTQAALRAVRAELYDHQEAGR